VKRLRKRVEPNPEEPQYILTVRGHGIRLVDDEAEK
jgi:DNA-binding response OmpR family regulator